jgi:hypothetical protein
MFMSMQTFAQNSSELAAMFAADQEARGDENIDWAVVRVEDAERRGVVPSLLRASDVKTALDYYNAAMIFQHGDSEEKIRLAHSF